MNQPIQTIVADAGALKEFITEAVTQAVEAAMPAAIRRSKHKEWLTKDDLKELTGWSNRTIQYLRDTRQIPFSQHGRKILYPTAGIEKFLKDHYVKPRKTEKNGG